MKKEDLIALGVDEETAKSIMALHGKTVTQLNAQVATAESERDGALQQLQSNQTELNSLKDAAKGNEELTQKLTDLQAAFDNSKADSEKALLAANVDYAIKLALKDEHSIDDEYIMEKLDRDTIKLDGDKLMGFEDQLKAIKESKPHLFQNMEQEQKKVDPPTPSIFIGGNPTGGDGDKSIVEKIKERLGE